MIWNNEGYRVDSNYNIFKNPLDMREHFEWFAENPQKDSAFTVQGKGKQMYLLTLADEHAVYILNNLLILSQSNKDIILIEDMLKNISGQELPEYSKSELDDINKIIENNDIEDEKPMWKGEKLEKEFTQPDKSVSKKPKRKEKIAANALKIANYLCEYDNSHKIFLRKNGKYNYTEPHHLIPLSQHEDFNFNLDVEENIVSLCSHCHNLLHYGRFEDKEPILQYLHKTRKAALEKVGLNLRNINDLEKYYL